MRYLLYLILVLCCTIGYCHTVTKIEHSNFSLEKESAIDVIICEFPSNKEIEVAKLLQKILKKVSNSENIHFVIGEKKHSGNFAIFLKKNENAKLVTPELKSFDYCDEYVFKIGKNSITIKYPDEYGALTAIGFFLKKYIGIKIFVPSEIGWEIPHLKNLKLRVGSSVFYPSFKGRFLGIYDKGIDTYSALNGENKKFIHWVHALNKIVNNDTINFYPNFMPYRNGKRQTYETSSDMQIDFLNDDLQKYVSSYAESFFKTHPNSAIFSISQADSNYFDETERTRKLLKNYTYHGYRDYSDVVFDFSNRVAKDIKLKFPNKFLMCLAYLYTENPPRFKLEDNLLVYICTDKSGYFHENKIFNDEKLFKEWANSGIKLFGNYDYNYGGQYFIPREISEYMSTGIKNSYKYGARVYTCESYPFWAYDAHKMWILSNLLLDVKKNHSDLEDEFFSEYYKEASEYIKKFFLIAKIAWNSQTDKPNWLKLYKRESQATILSERDLIKMESNLLLAESNANSQIIKDRIKEIRLAFNITKAFVAEYRAKAKLFSYSVKEEDSEEILLNMADITLLRYLKKCAIEKYLKETKYPKVNFSNWGKRDYIDCTNQVAEDLFNLENKQIDEVLFQITDVDISKSARMLRASKNILKNSYFKNGFKDWIIYRSGDCIEKAVVETINRETQVNLSSVNAVGVSQYVDVSPKKAYGMEVLVKGDIRAGDVCYIRMSFVDKHGNFLSSKYQHLPVMKNEFFRKMRVLGIAPEKTRKICCSIFVMNMNPSNSIYLKSFKLFESY